MGFEETTRKMADEVAATAKSVEELTRVLMPVAVTQASAAEAGLTLEFAVTRLAAAVEKLARCVSRRFPGTPDGEE